jgi:hypothetical protein
MITYKKAEKLEEIDQAVRFNDPISPDHEFYTNFSDLRGDFEEKLVYKNLNISKYKFDAKLNSNNKSLLFLGGMRGTGKTTELAKYAKKLNTADAFLCVTCNIDAGLNASNLEYMDILIFQLERLTEELENRKVKIDKGIINKMEMWFTKRSEEVNRSLKIGLGLEVGGGLKKDGILSQLLGIFASLKAGVTGSYERTEIVRKILQNRFDDFALIFNEYIEEVNIAIRKKKIGQEVLFIIDGLEKTMSVETRHKIIIQEAGYIQQIKAYTIFTLPIELMKERPALQLFSNLETFPFVKLYEKDGEVVRAAFDRFVEFTYKRIDKSLFENEKIVRKAIQYGGGSPRELLRILELTAFYADEEKGIIEINALDKALARLANQSAANLTEEMINKLQFIIDANKKYIPIPFDTVLEEMLEKNLVMEYNAGNYKRPNPILEFSDIYKYRIKEQ